MTGDRNKYLIFTLQGRRFAFDLAQVAEVEEVPVMWPIPSVPSCYPGAINFHGTIVAVMDLAAFLGFTDCKEPEKMITLDIRIASLAFLVEQVDRITPIDEAILAAAPNEDYATATLKLPDGDATLLDARLIVARAQETING
jgi:purine-binding chemotaxis protein CheW